MQWTHLDAWQTRCDLGLGSPFGLSFGLGTLLDSGRCKNTSTVHSTLYIRYLYGVVHRVAGQGVYKGAMMSQQHQLNTAPNL